MNLLIVDTSAQAKRLAALLGDGWRVIVCAGPLYDLPTDTLGVDIAHEFQPNYTVRPGQTNALRRLMQAVRDAQAIYLAGEAAHIAPLLMRAEWPAATPVYTVTLSALTADAVKDVLSQPSPFDLNQRDSWLTRRLIERLIGYLVAPLAAKTLGRSHPITPAVSFALRRLVERERELSRPVSQTYHLDLELMADGHPFTARLHRLGQRVAHFEVRPPLDTLAARLKSAAVWVQKTGERAMVVPPPPPFTTLTLIEAASATLGFSSDKMMALAQTLYEAGWITQPHTRGMSVTPDAQEAARTYIRQHHGEEYVPADAPIYTTPTGHSGEAIRPTDLERLPDSRAGDGAALYALIWRRFLASQMAAGADTLTGALIQVGPSRHAPHNLTFRTQARTPLFDGFRQVYKEAETEADTSPLPKLHEGQDLTLTAPVVGAHSIPPVRYTDGLLLESLLETGFEALRVIPVLLKAGYVTREGQTLVPTAAGEALVAFLTAHFDAALSPAALLHLNNQIARVATGETTRLTVLQDFWARLQPGLAAAAVLVFAPLKPQPLLLVPREEVTHG